MRHLPATKRAAAAVLRGGARLILERGHQRVPAYAWTWAPRPGCAVDIANAMSLTRFGVYATGGWAGKYWRCQDRAYGAAHDALLAYLEPRGSNVCGFNAAATRARDVVATMFGVGESLHPGPRPLSAGRVSTDARVRAWVAELERQVAAGLLTPVGLAAATTGGHGPDWQDQLLTSIREHEHAGRAYQAGGAR